MPAQIEGVSLYFELIQFENFARIEETHSYYDPINEQIPYECKGIKFEISFFPFYSIPSNFIIFFLFT